MSRIGQRLIPVPAGTQVEIRGRQVKVTGPNGTLEMQCHSLITVALDESKANVVVKNSAPDDREAKQLHGTMRSLIANMIIGASKGFEKKLQIFGTGYNVKEQGGKLVFAVGYCHPVEMPIPKGIKVNIEVPATRGNEVPAKFSLTGADKQVLGQFAANLRRIRPPEPYKGKGIRYADEHVRRKVGKAFASGG